MNITNLYTSIAKRGAGAIALVLMLSSFASTAFATDTATLFTSANGTYTAWTGDESDVDDSPGVGSCGAGGTFIEASTTGDRESYTVSLATIPDGSTITSVAVTTYDRGASVAGGTYQSLVRLDGANTSSGVNLSATGGAGDPCSSAKTQNIDVPDTIKVGATALEIGVRKTGGNTNAVRIGAIRTVITYTLDTTAPTVTEVTAVPSPTNDSTPSYTFSTTEAGAISYGGSCSSATTTAVVGNNTISFNTLADGTYSNCTVTVTDIATNASTPLSVNTFMVDTEAPVITVTGGDESLGYGEVYVDQGATIDDDSTIVTVNPVVGLVDVDTYQVTYNATDAAGNVATEKTRSVEVTKRAITVSTVTDTKAYDGDTSSVGVPTLTGTLASGDTGTRSQTFADENAGDNKTLVPAIDLGVKADNYEVTLVDTVTGEITPLSASVTITAEDKGYDGTDLADVTFDLTGILMGDDVSAEAESSTFSDKHVGTNKTVTSSGITLTGDEAGNYELLSDEATDEASISLRSITVTADANGKDYGQEDPELTYTFTVGSLAEGDSLTGGLSREVGEAPGTYDINQNNLVLGSGMGGDYAMTFVGGVFTIVKAEAGIELSDTEQEYDGSEKAVTVTTDPEELGVTVTYDGLPALPTDVGVYDVEVTVVDDNYEGTATGTLTIIADELSLVFGELDNKTIGDEDFTVSATADEALATPVEFTSNTPEVCTVSLEGLVHLVAIGDCELAATQEGDANHTTSLVTQSFEVLPVMHAITATAGTGGSISPSGTVEVEEGDNETFEFEASEGYHVHEVLVDDVAVVEPGTEYTFEMVTGDHTISVSFAVTPTCDDGYVFNGSECVFTEVPPSCPEGTTNEEGNCVADPLEATCPEGVSLVEGTCVLTEETAPTCETGSYDSEIDLCVDGEATSPPTCPEGASLEGDMCVATEETTPTCPSGFELDGDSCVFTPVAPSCPEGASEVEGMCVAPNEAATCPPGMHQEGNMCVDNPNNAPVANDHSVTVVRNSFKDITLSASDADESELSYIIVDGPTHGVLTGEGSEVTYTPNENYDGLDSFTFKVNDGEDDSNVATVSIRVEEELSSGGGGGGSRRSNDSNTPAPETGGGEVLGSSAYFFSVNFGFGTSGTDVTELQKILIAASYLKIDAPTGYFGPLTLAAVKLYQGARGIPQTGYVGPLTRGALNGTAAGSTTGELEAQLKALQEELAKMMGN